MYYLCIRNKNIKQKMENNNSNAQYQVLDSITGTGSVSKTFIADVFKWMFVALGISAVFAYLFASNVDLMSYLVSETGLSGLGYIVLLAPIGFVLLMSFGVNKLSYPAMLLVFLLYSAINGISFSFILLRFTPGSVLTTFLTASAMFGIMAVMGYTTKQDLTKFGSIMVMGLIGIFIATLINMFMHSGTMSYVVSVIGVIVFTGLTAYDVQKLKTIGTQVEPGTEATGKMSLMGALTLYLDFINLFLMLLRLFGSRK